MRTVTTMVPIATMLLVTALAAAQQQPSVAARARAATDLPRLASGLRDAGVTSTELRAALDTMRDRKVPAPEAKRVLETETRAVAAHGEVDNFGGFVREKLEQGKRGRELAEAIRKHHEEHGRRGGGAPGKATGAGTKAADKASSKKAAAKTAVKKSIRKSLAEGDHGREGDKAQRDDRQPSRGARAKGNQDGRGEAPTTDHGAGKGKAGADERGPEPGKTGGNR